MRLAGHAPDTPARKLLETLARLGCSGTLTLTRERGQLLVLLAEGEARATFALGEPGALDDPAGAYGFEAHAPGELPQLGSGHPSAAIAALRALPRLAPPEPFRPALTDLKALLAELRGAEADAALTWGRGNEAGIAVLCGGSIGAALYERDGFVWERGDALRALYRHSLEAGGPPLLLWQLGSALARALLGLALDARAAGADPDGYDGIRSSETGYTYYRDGRAYLQVRATPAGAGISYAAPTVVPSLALPDDPPGWERSRYALTLRGRDALNPMTELAMNFGANHGRHGRRVLDALRRGLSVEETAAQLGCDLDDLKPWLERLETEGLIRPAE